MNEDSTILVIEDDAEILAFLGETLRSLGYQFDSARDGAAGLEKARAGRHALVIIDVNLPNQSGFDVCREIRARDRFTPLLILTCRADEVDRVLGLELGADDFVTKPFNVRELEARIRALIRRGKLSRDASWASDKEPIVRGDIEIDLMRTAVKVAGKEEHFTALEFELLVFLARHPGRTFTREELMTSVWGHHHAGIDPTLTKHLSRLRLKIEPDPTRQRYIKTVRGIGYRFASLDEL